MNPSFPPKSIAVVLGTRPEVVKLAHIIRLLGDSAFVVHSGQHYDDSLSRVFFEAFGLSTPDATFDIGGATRGAQIGEATRLLDELFGAHDFQGVVVQGDTNTTAAGALAANGSEIPLIHVEAGLRSFDRRMPEEHNRVITDHLADLCCAPTETTASNLAAEGIPPSRVVTTGNTVVEAVTELMPSDRQTIRAAFGVERDGYALATLHRPENVDDPRRLSTILEELRALPLPVVYPIHPRTAATIAREGIDAAGIQIIEPLDYVTFLGLAAGAAVLISDSGGVQEEVSVFKRPVVVVRRSTERPEVIGTFATLVEAGPAIGSTVRQLLDDLAGNHAILAATPSPYGDGTASQSIVTAIGHLIG